MTPTPATPATARLQADARPPDRAIPASTDAPRLSLYLFASSDDYSPSEYYRFALDAALCADRGGLEAVWIPERHFVSFGGVSPNPAVLGAAIAACTSRIGIRAGSVAAPLHHPVRIAEDWAVLDNLSRGRVGVSFATGWHVDDFLLASRPHRDRKATTVATLDQVRALWAGHAVTFPDPDGMLRTAVLRPRPISPRLPVWITAAGNPETFELAGRVGAGVMSALFGQTTRQLSSKIARYRAAWQTAGHDGRGHVVTMVHACVSTAADLRDRLRPALRRYFAAYTAQTDGSVDDAVFETVFESYVDGPSLLGTPEKAARVLDELGRIGVDEVGALTDFGLPCGFILDTLPALASLTSPATIAPPLTRGAP